MVELIAAQWNAWLAAYLWPLVRVLAFVMVAPPFSNREVPARVKVALSVLVAIVIAPTLPAMSGVTVGSPEGLRITLLQIVIGVVLGFCVKTVFAAVSAAGELISVQMGLGFATLFDSSQTESNMVVGKFLSMAALTAFVAADGHLALLSALHDSFMLFPISPAKLQAPGWMELAGMGAVVFSLGLRLALPVIAVLLVVNLALAVLSRATAQLNPFAIGLTATLLVGLLLLSLTLISMAPLMERAVADGLETGAAALKLF
jgi:flagellar biosynthetic protein FliR